MLGTRDKRAKEEMVADFRTIKIVLPTSVDLMPHKIDTTMCSKIKSIFHSTVPQLPTPKLSCRRCYAEVMSRRARVVKQYGG